MELVLSKPTLSLFQQYLIRGVESGILQGKVLEQTTRDLGELIEIVARHTYKATGLEETYQNSLNLVNYILSFALHCKLQENQGNTASHTSLKDLYTYGAYKLTEVNTLPEFDFFSVSHRGKISEFDVIIHAACKKDFDAKKVLKERLTQIKIRELYLETFLLAQYIVELKYPTWSPKTIETFCLKNGDTAISCTSIVNSYLFSIIFEETKEGYELTKKIFAKLAKRNRPSLEMARQILVNHSSTIPDNLKACYVRHVTEFLGNRTIKSFFGGKIKRIERLFDQKNGPLYCFYEYSLQDKIV